MVYGAPAAQGVASRKAKPAEARAAKRNHRQAHRRNRAIEAAEVVLTLAARGDDPAVT